ncbi:MAG: class I SAM-dependent methyltransferase [Nannocystaceae bacterium]|nr:class I SAM-dependent methyltransferase [bacterium]
MTAYDDRPIPRTHPSVIATAARRRSLTPPPLSNARVLEVGCAHGVNLMAMAARLPDARFVGVDIDARAIEIAARRAAEARLDNVTFACVDLSALDDEGPYDYVIAHGVLSWVAPAVAEALFALLARVLAPEGLAYVSYDAKPGACMREALGLGLRAAPHSDDVLETLRDSPALAGSPAGAWLAAEVSAALQRPRSYREQQFMGEQHALCVGEVWDWARRHQLHYVHDVAEVGLPAEAVARTRAAVERCASERRAVEQLFDVAIMRQFRATILGRQAPGIEVAVARDAPPARNVPLRPRVRPLCRLEARELGFVSTDAHVARAVHPLHGLLIEHCDGARDHAALGQVVIEAVRNGTLELPSEAGTPATLEEVEAGIDLVLGAAIADLASAGVVV